MSWAVRFFSHVPSFGKNYVISQPLFFCNNLRNIYWLCKNFRKQKSPARNRAFFEHIKTDGGSDPTFSDLHQIQRNQPVSVRSPCFFHPFRMCNSQSFPCFIHFNWITAEMGEVIWSVTIDYHIIGGIH